MQTVTIREAKARLNALVEAAEGGEQVILMRGSRIVAAIVPASTNDLELAPRLSDPQAERFWQRLREERASGASLAFDAPDQAVAFLASRRRPRTGGPRTAPATRRRPRRAR